MTRYSELWREERNKVLKLHNEVRELTRQRDQYLAFIRETDQQNVFLRWIAPKMGINLEEIEGHKDTRSVT